MQCHRARICHVPLAADHCVIQPQKPGMRPASTFASYSHRGYIGCKASYIQSRVRNTKERNVLPASSPTPARDLPETAKAPTLPLFPCQPSYLKTPQWTDGHFFARKVCMLGYGLNDGVGVGIAFAMKSEALRGQLWFGSILGEP